MGSAIIAGALAAGILEADNVCVVEPDGPRRAALRDDHGVEGVATVREGLDWLTGRPRGQALLAIKPQALGGVEVGAGLDGRVVISILAGTPGERIRAAMPGARVVRAMPNLAARLRQSVTAVCASAGAGAGDAAFARRLFGGIGPVVVEIDEHLMDAFTALAGSGPAYVFYLAEAMIRTGVGAGFDPATAARIVQQTIAGASALMAASQDDPGTLRTAVTSKGGTTQAAIEVFNHHRVGQHIGEAIEAATDRAAELARE